MLYDFINKMAAAYALLMFSLTVIVGIFFQVGFLDIFMRAFIIFGIYRVFGWLLVYILFYENQE